MLTIGLCWKLKLKNNNLRKESWDETMSEFLKLTIFIKRHHVKLIPLVQIEKYKVEQRI